MAMANSSRWYLKRIKFESVHYLNSKKTSFGRRKDADIVTISNICSRTHCELTINANDKVTVSNLSSNGTFVNEDRIVAEHELKHLDIIGLGVSPSIYDHVTEEYEKYFLFQLIDKSAEEVLGVISLISDDDEEEDIKPNVADLDVEIIHENICARDEHVPVNNDAEDEIDMVFSQQVLDIKQEVNCPDEIVSHAADFSIIIDSDLSDNESNSWMYKLSQNQDLVKKVSESIKTNALKRTKQIEAIPMLPAKKARRNSIAIKSQSKHEVAPSTLGLSTTPDDLKSPQSSHSSKSPKSPNNQDQNKVPAHFVDRLDPFAANQKKNDNPANYGDALKQAGSTPKKKRIAHVPKKPQQIVSILRSDNCHSEERRRKRVGLRVRFSPLKPTVHEYEPDCNVSIAPAPKPSPTLVPERPISFNFDPLHIILTDITEWKTEWIANKSTTPPINGVDNVIFPLIDKYQSFEEYHKIVTPLLKHELWASILAENRHKNRFDGMVTEMYLLKRGDRQRFVFHVQVCVESSHPKAMIGDYLRVDVTGHPSFFTYVTDQKFVKSGYNNITHFTMEASEIAVKFKSGENKILHITPIANIRTELKLFNAVFYLERTPLKNVILDPSLLAKQKRSKGIPKYEYAGCGRLNDVQTKILQSVYHKCLSSETNLALIEGPPGTGKTKLIVSMILQLVFGKEMKKKLRILVVTPSNAAVDIIATSLIRIREKLPSSKQQYLNVIRFGVLNSMHPDVRKIAPQCMKTNGPVSPPKNYIKSMLETKQKLQKEIQQFRGRPNANHSVLQDRIKEHEKRIQQINEQCDKATCRPKDADNINEVMANARVVCSTLSSSINLKQYIKKFDVCFIDEASQCTEPWSLVPLQYNVTSLILVGDSNQLSPVVLSSVCRENCLGRSLFTRLYDTISMNGTNTSDTYAMTTQYRMHPEICDFSNKYFYKGRLVSEPRTNSHFQLRPYNIFSLTCEQSNKDMVNYFNIEEAQFVVTMLKVMVKHANPNEFSYGIITPYAKQRAVLQHLLTNSQTLTNFDIPVNTIDSYQGQEKDVIILCTTRTIGIGFLANPQRLNVALTRAKKCLVICGNFQSISNVPVWKELLKNAERRQKIHKISNNYNFQTIADLLLKKTSKPMSKPAVPSNKTNPNIQVV